MQQGSSTSRLKQLLKGLDFLISDVSQDNVDTVKTLGYVGSIFQKHKNLRNKLHKTS